MMVVVAVLGVFGTVMVVLVLRGMTIVAVVMLMLRGVAVLTVMVLVLRGMPVQTVMVLMLGRVAVLTVMVIVIGAVRVQRGAGTEGKAKDQRGSEYCESRRPTSHGSGLLEYDHSLARSGGLAGSSRAPCQAPLSVSSLARIEVSPL